VSSPTPPPPKKIPPPLPPKPPKPPKKTWQSANVSAIAAPSKPGVKLCVQRLPMIAVNWRQHDFGRIRKGSTPPVYDLIISSTGSLNLASITVTLTSSQFKIDNPGAFATTLPPGSTTTVKVKFEPTAYGPKAARIKITSNAANENPLFVGMKGKQYSVITFVVEDDPSGTKIDGVKLKVKQAGQAEQEVTTNNGKIEVETEHDGNFEILRGEYDGLLEFRSLASA